MILSFRFLSLTISIHWTFPLATFMQIYFFAGRAIWLRGMHFTGAILAASLASLFYILCGIVHQLGHAMAAQLVGYPMKGFRLWMWFNMSEYPEYEPELPARTHIARSLGGPVASALMFLLSYWIFQVTRGEEPWLDYFGILALLLGGYFFLVSTLITDGLLFLMMRGWRGKFLELGQTAHTERI